MTKSNDDPRRRESGPSRSTESTSEHQRADALTNAVYGAIIMTAFFGAVDDRVDSATELLAELLFATLVLFVAHLFASGVGAEAAAEQNLSVGRVLGIIRVQLPLVLVVAIPSLLLLLAAVGAFSVDAAVNASLAYGVFVLFLVSFSLGRHHGRGVARSSLYGAIGAGLGAAIVALELALH